MGEKKVSSVTLTILTESPVALSNDQGFGNYTPIKKSYMSDGEHATTSVGTVTYEIRTALHNKGWNLSDIVLNINSNGKITNMYSKVENTESCDKKSLENDIMGFFVPDKQISKTSPLRIIPPKSLHTFKNNTQLITNRGFLDKDLERDYYDKDGNKYEGEIPNTQALATEEVFGDYYVYTITIELDRFGVQEVKDGKYLASKERIYMDKDIRKEALKDIVDVICNLTRRIKHQTVHLKPLAIFGGIYESVIPYFWNDVIMDNENNLILDNIVETICSYDLDLDNTIAIYSSRINTKIKNIPNDNDKNDNDKKAAFEFIKQGYPVKKIKSLVDKIEISDDNKWYIKG